MRIRIFFFSALVLRATLNISRKDDGGGHWDSRFCGFGYFLGRVFGFCAKRLRFFGFRVHCGLRIFHVLASGLVVSVINTSGFSVLVSDEVFGFSYFVLFGFRFLFDLSGNSSCICRCETPKLLRGMCDSKN